MEVEVNSHMSARGFLQTCLLVLLHVWLSLPDALSRWPNQQAAATPARELRNINDSSHVAHNSLCARALALSNSTLAGTERNSLLLLSLLSNYYILLRVQ